MSTSGRRNEAGSDNEEEETPDAKIERLGTEIEELNASLIGVPEWSGEWLKIKAGIKDRDVERLVLIEKKRCDDVVKEYFEEKPQMLEAIPECPVCLELIVEGYGTRRNICCGKHICFKCNSQGGDALLETCPLCRGEAPSSIDEAFLMVKEKADSGIAWAQADVGECYFNGMHGVQKDVEKALSLYKEASEKGCTSAMTHLGRYYIEKDNYEEARQWYEASAEKGEIYSLFQLGCMMQDGLAFDKNEETRAEAFRLLTISATLFRDTFNGPAMSIARFFHDSPPVMLHYLRPAVEEGDTSAAVISNYALGKYLMGIEYYGEKVISTTGHNPVPEALFWFRQYSRKKKLPAEHPLVELERIIRENCARCRADLPEGKQSCCVECKAVYYCNRDCQVAHWKAGHKKDCVKKLKKRLRAEGKLDEEK